MLTEEDDSVNQSQISGAAQTISEQQGDTQHPDAVTSSVLSEDQDLLNMSQALNIMSAESQAILDEARILDDSEVDQSDNTASTDKDGDIDDKDGQNTEDRDGSTQRPAGV